MKTVSITILKVVATLEEGEACGELDDTICHLIEKGLAAYNGVSNVETEVIVCHERGRLINGVGNYLYRHEELSPTAPIPVESNP